MLRNAIKDWKKITFLSKKNTARMTAVVACGMAASGAIFWILNISVQQFLALFA